MIVAGDMNINLNAQNPENRDYINCFQSNGYICLNKLDTNYYTRRSNTIDTYIDHILTDLIDRKFALALLDTAISDHRALLLSLPSEKQRKVGKNQPNHFTIIDYGSIDRNLSKLNEAIEVDSLETLQQNISNFIREHTKTVAKKEIKIKREWANAHLLNIIHMRNKFYKKLKKYPENTFYLAKFKELKKQARNVRNHLKKMHYAALFEKNNNDCRKTWKIINAIMYNKSHSTQTIQKIVYKDRTITDNLEIAEAFNKHFIEIIEGDENEPAQIPLVNPNYPRLEFTPTTEEEIYGIIKNLNTNSSNGPDGISAKFIQKYRQILVTPFSRLLNKSFSMGVFPEGLKMGAVVPIYKEGNKLSCSNYRPITKLSVIDKIYEQAILVRLKIT